jgi:hypothetical protein
VHVPFRLMLAAFDLSLNNQNLPEPSRHGLLQVLLTRSSRDPHRNGNNFLPFPRFRERAEAMERRPSLAKGRVLWSLLPVLLFDISASVG